MIHNILVKPVISEKANELSALGKYTFVVAKKANKIEIGKAIEKMYNVNVAAVNTFVMPVKVVTRSGRSGVMKGVKPAYKKAVVTLVSGETIDIFQNNED
ncbi:MAG: 50S ribosomal protein L23 [Saprospiraceae bacterium]|jgi:large subunit ribosomal protein L23|uniref:50S ribosomal protein L23 n=1 Tax=Candidatus Brachybacter algidus TaxID=2982024 RepID=UPI001B6CCEB8|nr:50S ribosomal protein L23 [Candidatus Brachybacter algidus]MBP7304916.1 50S ribosomal protein L23 [Saprospiraceae bacterium]MBK6449736.1 50S ribosomal protein L23 [Candidatus Brachybacter algidus]MBK7604376.1 50S ribosomal protein L23 [Candidatus Brachybacter algidus]MBK8355455.1 50S ribosomal protein L23 [Candidatus Brachybacter algidus]MBK8602964.1 50S ribosomal protein L23 [Candidatus Brachybacter algidus]